MAHQQKICKTGSAVEQRSNALTIDLVNTQVSEILVNLEKLISLSTVLLKHEKIDDIERAVNIIASLRVDAKDVKNFGKGVTTNGHVNPVLKRTSAVTFIPEVEVKIEEEEEKAPAKKRSKPAYLDDDTWDEVSSTSGVTLNTNVSKKLFRAFICSRVPVSLKSLTMKNVLSQVQLLTQRNIDIKTLFEEFKLIKASGKTEEDEE